MATNIDAPGALPKLNRRGFIAAVSLMAAAEGLASRTPDEPLLDIHQHTNYGGRTDQQLVAHQAYHLVTTTVLLPGAGWMLSELGDNASCAKLQADFPDMFLRFACSDVAESRTEDVLRGNIHRGAIGFGELKFHVAVDSPEMHRVYKLADELKVPVLLHFQYEMYNTGFERFESILKAYPRVIFIGHAQTWWGHISSELDPMVMYPTGRVKPGGLTDRWLSDYANVYGDLSAGSGANALTRDPDFAQDFLERHYRKLLWGSDCPCRDGKGAGTSDHRCIAGTSLTALRKLLPDAAKLRRILYENAAALYHLSKV
jgi:predicted TIM-barrel fold metal-dependent hydrolase